ncbi:MAG: DNA-directed RNA polymerase subunit D [Candidatus Aenigmarchaeota archaeon]|nr:DNA-directed RNA polymerase subunit D [Candidatus Aenigmarchaeota archaeon]
MKIQIVKKSDRKMKFILSDSNPAFANALRRVMTNEVPTMAIEYVEFQKNSSAMFDEIIAHRLGMIPLTYSNAYSLPSECKCKGKGCSHCQAKLSFDSSKIKKPKNTDTSYTVVSGDLNPSDPDIKPLNPDIPIVELFNDQELKFDAVARLGVGMSHAKWQAANVGFESSNDTRFIFNVESVSGLKTIEILEKALNILEEKVKIFLKEVK